MNPETFLRSDLTHPNDIGKRSRLAIDDRVSRPSRSGIGIAALKRLRCKPKPFGIDAQRMMEEERKGFRSQPLRIWIPTFT